jgi:hypothetical protein
MNIFMDDSDLIEIKPVDETKDYGMVILPTIGKRGEGIDDELKEIIAEDAIQHGPTKAAEIHGVPVSTASRYSNGKDISNPDVKAKILGMKHDIADLAVVKLMDTLNLIDPRHVTKVRDRIALMGGLTKVVDSMVDVKRDEKPQVHLHLFCPEQKKVEDYKVIDV